MALALLANVGLQQSGAVVTDNVIPLTSASHFVQVDLNHLVAGLETPCRIFLFHGGNFAKIYDGGENVPLHDMPRLRIEFYAIGFVFESDFPAWENWLRDRHAFTGSLEVMTDKVASLEDRRVKPEQTQLNAFVSYAFDTVRIKTADEAESRKLELCNTYFRGVASNKAIEWYFQKPPAEELLRHGARVSYLTLLFTTFTLPKMPLDALETLLLSAIAHELVGDLRDTSGKATSIATLEEIKRRKQLLPEKLIELIRQHDEHYDGGGMPRNLKGDQISVLARIFSFANDFDHLYLMSEGASRRVRMEQALAAIDRRREKFDPKLMKFFLKFIERVEIIE